MSGASVSEGSTTGRDDRRGGGLGSTLVLALGTFAVGTDAFVVAGFLPAMAGDLGVSPAAAGQSVTVFAIAYAAIAPLVAATTARIPRRRLLVGALVLLGIANLGSALAPSLAILLVSRVIAAAGAAAYTPNAGAVSASLVRPELRGRALAVVIGGLTVATALGVPLGDVAGEAFGWRVALALVAALSVAIALGVLLIMPALPGNPSVPLSTRLAVLRNPNVVVVLLLTVLGMASCYTVYAYVVPSLDAVGVDGGAVTLMLFLYGFGAVLGNLASGYCTDRWGSVRVLSVAYVCMALALAALALLATTEVVLAVLVGFLALMWGGTSWSQTPAQQHRLIAAAPHEAPLVVALNSSCIYLGIGAGTAVGGLLFGAGPPAMYAAGAALALVSLVFLTVSSRALPAVTPEPEAA